MHTEFVIRLIDAERRVLAWARLGIEARGDGRLYATTDFHAVACDTGVAVAFIWHWPDVHAHGTTPLPMALHLTKDAPIGLAFNGNPIVELPSEMLPLPAVTETAPVRAEIPSGTLLAKPSSGIH